MLAVAILGVRYLGLMGDARRPRMFSAFAGAVSRACLFGGSASGLRMIVPGGQKWRSCRGRSSTAIACASPVSAISNTAARDDFTVRYEEREVSISHLTSLDFFVSYWKKGPVGHTFLSFNFDNAPPLCISIETRPEVGEGFSPIASLFKQFELIYVVGDERDIVRVRTNYRNEDVYLYRILTSPGKCASAFSECTSIGSTSSLITQSSTIC